MGSGASSIKSASEDQLRAFAKELEEADLETVRSALRA